MSSTFSIRCEIHPVSFKLSFQGHPWITEDSYTKKFPNRALLIEGFSNKRRAGLFIHDPKHSKIKGRFWTKNKLENLDAFKEDFISRLKVAIEKRVAKGILEKRQNVYLLFGEADNVPGLFIQKVGEEILIQFYSYFWQDQSSWLLNAIKETINYELKLNLSKDHFWTQFRAEKSSEQRPPENFNKEIKEKIVEFSEYGILYKAHFGVSYDIGIYTDMSAIRGKLHSYFEKASRVLNLYSYTGAFSLFALGTKAEDVVSVDLSKTYLEWLGENLALNGFEDKHKSVCTSCMNALKNFTEAEKTFDLIICDPPSSSTDGKKKTQALTEYERTLPLMLRLLEKKGHIVLFLNTHTISKDKFKAKIKEILTTTNKYSLVQELSLSDDCAPLKGFTEGNYLKGLIIRRND